MNIARGLDKFNRCEQCALCGVALGCFVPVIQTSLRISVLIPGKAIVMSNLQLSCSERPACHYAR